MVDGDNAVTCGIDDRLAFLVVPLGLGVVVCDFIAWELEDVLLILLRNG